MLGRTVILSVALTAAAPTWAAESWRPLFNGRDLEGWTVKINHRPAGENWRDTFRVEDGVLKVSYASYGRFTDEFAHLTYRTPFADYRLRLEYRFTGDPTPGAPTWAARNSGVMIHGQAPQTMGLDQPFPVSVEAQLLGAGPGEARTTGNVCTPGVTVSIGGASAAEHCRNSQVPTQPDGQWVKLEIEVRGARSVRQWIDGRLALDYGDVRLAPAEYATFRMPAGELAAKGGAPLDRGYISLQGEGSPLEFRRIEILDLADEAPRP